jgi:hypothetical protein
LVTSMDFKLVIHPYSRPFHSCVVYFVHCISILRLFLLIIYYGPWDLVIAGYRIAVAEMDATNLELIPNECFDVAIDKGITINILPPRGAIIMIVTDLLHVNLIGYVL